MCSIKFARVASGYARVLVSVSQHDGMGAFVSSDFAYVPSALVSPCGSAYVREFACGYD